MLFIYQYSAVVDRVIVKSISEVTLNDMGELTINKPQ